MIYEYICPLCEFIFRTAKEYKFFKCPSCSVQVQAILFLEDDEMPQKEEKDWSMN